jgi:hypothetical protein
MMAACPYCRKELDLMEIFHESDTTAVIGMLPSFGRHSHVVMGYCYLFGVSPWRLKVKKIRILLTELKALFDTESFSYQKRIYRISQAGIGEALNIVVKKEFANTLDSHNYLKKIMIGIAEREEKDSGRKAETNLRKKEAGLMTGTRGSGPYPVPEEQASAPAMRTIPPAPDHLTPEQREENRRQAQELIRKIGKKIDRQD